MTPTYQHLIGIFITSALALATSPRASHAVTGPDRSGLETAAGPPVRAHAALVWNQPPGRAKAAWSDFKRTVGGRWHTLWDQDTGVPQRIYGPGISMPGSVASPAAAERYARAFLARHIALLAPGARAEDFIIVSNHLADGMRTVGMYQYHHGLRVLGGQVSFRFKGDRLFVIGSEALPGVTVPKPSQMPAAALLRSQATAWVRDHADVAWAGEVSGPYIVPIVRAGAITYHTVMQVTVEARQPFGRYHVYLDAATGATVARQQALRFAEGTVQFNVPKRWPKGGRHNLPARDAAVTVGGTQMSTNGNGILTWTPDAEVSIDTHASGRQVRVDNAEVKDDTADNAKGSFTLVPGGTVIWNQSLLQNVDAQIATFIHARIAKDYTRTFAPDLQYLDQQLVATVNIDDSCNAFSDGETINFFQGDDRCENTGRLADVVYHEFGHVVHMQSLIEGVGSFEPAFSEGLADYLAAAITDDPGMGRGFRFDDEPLRHIDPDDKEHRWPEDIGEIHYTGLIFAGAMWDLRKHLIATYGPEGGIALANRLFYAAVQRATSIPSTYIEILAADDDDGDLSNGTPNECAINDFFGGPHGLRPLDTDFIPLGVQPPEVAGYDVSLQIMGVSSRCAGDSIAGVTLHWGVRGVDEGARHAVAMSGTDGMFTGTIPQQQSGQVVRYRVAVELANGSQWSFPSNQADPEYELYVGDLVELYCTDFETDPFTEGWTHGATRNPSGDLWQWGPPMGTTDKNDPPSAFSGTSVLGTQLAGNTKYPNLTTSHAETPLIDVASYSDVRLHYRRWLTVEDAFYDHATIYANDQQVWRNQLTDATTVHHLDSQWVFHDVPLSAQITDGTVKVRFEIESDEGLEFGGWNIDELCVVANPASVCGDGAVSGAEQCDEGSANTDMLADGCRSNCRVAACGDGVVDTGEICDDANADDMDGCTKECKLTPENDEGCGCRAGSSPGNAVSIMLLGLLVMVMTRRRCR